MKAQIAAAALSVWAGAAGASVVVFDNLDPSPSPYPYANAGWWFGSFANSYNTVGSTFTPSASGQLDELWAGMFQIAPSGSSTVTLSLYPDVGGAPSGTPWQTVGTLPGAFGQVLHLTGLAGPMLTMGQTYWLFASVPNDGVSMGGWYQNNQGDLGAIFNGSGYYTNTDRAALRVGVAQAPAPGTLALLCAAGTVYRRRRR